MLLATGLIVHAASAFAENPAEQREFQKKAEFINSFTRFVDWPARKFAQPDSPFVIGVYGMDNISTLLQESNEGRQIKGHPVVIKRLLNKEELRACHVLFISRSERERLSPILAAVQRENVLTVGECDNFLGRGGIINFVMVGGQIRFQVSMDGASREKLTFSSKLLQVAVPSTQGISFLPVDGVKLIDAPR